MIYRNRAQALLDDATPSPWTIGRMDYAGQMVGISAPFGDSSLSLSSWRDLAIVYGNEDQPEQGYKRATGNAALIAYAPELAETVIALWDSLPNRLRDIAAECSGADYDLLSDAADLLERLSGAEP
jgi:hypothetical protein